jgi:hypothetical protein
MAAAKTMVGMITASTTSISSVKGKMMSPTNNRRRYVGTNFTIQSLDLFHFNYFNSEQ